jgi:hypothetical protein
MKTNLLKLKGNKTEEKVGPLLKTVKESEE